MDPWHLLMIHLLFQRGLNLGLFDDTYTFIVLLCVACTIGTNLDGCSLFLFLSLTFLAFCRLRTPTTVIVEEGNSY